MLIGDRTFTLLMFMLHMDMHGASSIVPHAALWHLGFDFHLSLESGACQIDSSAVSHRCIRRVQRERNMQNGMITILGDARLRSGYLPHAKRAIYQLIYIPESQWHGGASALHNVGHYPNTALFNNNNAKKNVFPWQGSGLSSLGRKMLKSLAKITRFVWRWWWWWCPPLFGKFSQRAGQWFSTAPSTAHGARSAAATELRRSRCCDGGAQHELRRAHSARRVSRTRRAEWWDQYSFSPALL